MSSRVTKSKRAEPRIPFGWVVERGLLPPGTVLQGQQKSQRAKVRADGTLVCADATGSIHRIGAHVQGLDACNGWTFWQFELNGKLVPIDVLRQRLRADSGLSEQTARHHRCAMRDDFAHDGGKRGVFNR